MTRSEVVRPQIEAWRGACGAGVERGGGKKTAERRASTGTPARRRAHAALHLDLAHSTGSCQVHPDTGEVRPPGRACSIRHVCLEPMRREKKIAPGSPHSPGCAAPADPCAGPSLHLGEPWVLEAWDAARARGRGSADGRISLAPRSGGHLEREKTVRPVHGRGGPASATGTRGRTPGRAPTTADPATIQGGGKRKKKKEKKGEHRS
jgi:hypothetical protein